MIENTTNLNRTIDVMSQNLDNQDSPRIGIFWYDVRNDEFNLEGQNYSFEIAIHWELGHGWEG